MQFLAQVDLADADPQGAGLLAVFMCQNDPGLCSEWEPLAGGNHAVIFDAGAVQTATVDVIGQIGGRPLWVQGDETPTCRDCAQPMALFVQLQEGHGEQSLANFGGGGCGYAFRCGPCGTAAFLWQG